MRQIPFLEPGTFIEEFFTGITHDRNMSRVLDHFAEHKSEICVHGDDFWTKSGLQPSQSVSGFYESHSVSEDSEQFVEPTFGAYKCASLD